ncbi:MAG: DUF4105 domain-containing protein [Cytophagaceae bacterium]|jgi:uncharacterized membrane protein|nr:DUF4105 domain-containing protein [Cytophagaceae bacterium]
MKKLLWLCCFCFSLSAQQLSPSTVVSLITVSPGDELYNSFGHSALLIEDQASKVSRMYNYGTFDFEDPNFYTNFTRGKLRYMLAVEDPRYLYQIAQWENRAIVQQVLRLSTQQAQRLFDFLENNAKPENCFYKYDFFYDNCSSRLRDVLNTALGDSIQWVLPETNNKSFRALIDPYLDNQRYQDMGMDLGMGTPADKIATPAQLMFLPDYLKDFVGKAKVFSDGKWQPLVSQERRVLHNAPFPSDPFWKKPGLLMGSILLITFLLTWWQYRRPAAGHWFDVLMFSLAGLISLLLIFLWFFTDHGVTKWNLHLLWANPLTFVIVAGILKKTNTAFFRGLLLTYFFSNALLLLFWNQWNQELNGYLAPLVAALALRSIYVYYRLIKKTETDGVFGSAV